jgi:hypothetical protein
MLRFGRFPALLRMARLPALRHEIATSTPEV